jgi:methionine sulfoxide reductase heme-binding subunit
MTDPSQHLFWITSRAAGTTALVLSSASVGFGLAMAGKLLKGNGSDRRSIHQTLSLAVMIAIGVHGLSLIGDQYLHPSLLDVTVPFVLSYKTLATSAGIVAGWSLIALGLSYWWRSKMGPRRWKMIHRFTLLAWMVGIVHAFTEGTDAGQAWFIAVVALTAIPALGLLALRLVGRRRPATRRRVTAEVA